jgi:hypothetical protein
MAHRWIGQEVFPFSAKTGRHYPQGYAHRCHGDRLGQQGRQGRRLGEAPHAARAWYQGPHIAAETQVGSAVMSAGLPGRQNEADRAALRVRDGVDLGRQPPSGTPQSVILAPLFRSPPAGGPGQWCYRASGTGYRGRR